MQKRCFVISPKSLKILKYNKKPEIFGLFYFYIFIHFPAVPACRGDFYIILSFSVFSGDAVKLCAELYACPPAAASRPFESLQFSKIKSKCQILRTGFALACGLGQGFRTCRPELTAANISDLSRSLSRLPVGAPRPDSPQDCHSAPTRSNP